MMGYAALNVRIAANNHDPLRYPHTQQLLSGQRRGKLDDETSA